MRKSFNSVLSILLCTLLLFGSIGVGCEGLAEVIELFSIKASAANIESGSCGDNVTYILDTDTGLLTISGTGEMENYDWRDSPFYNNTAIKSVVIETGVTSIGVGTFEDCTGLKRITIPDSVTSIGEGAFKCCLSLKKLTISNFVISIGKGAFEYCAALKSIKVDSGNTIYDSREKCNAIIETKTNTLISGCKNTTIPNSVTRIGDYAFKGCVDLKRITVPNSITTIGGSAFENCSLKKITVPNSVTSLGESAFEDCTSLKNITILNSVTSIGDCAFKNCAGLENITLPNSITTIGGSVFENCTGLESITIPNSVTRIGVCAFYDCDNLKSITIPNSVTSIGDDAYYCCPSLESIKVDSGNTVYDSRENCNALIETKTNTLLTGCKNTIIPNSVTSIDDCAFFDCTGLESITIPNSVTSIGDGTFSWCSGLESIKVDSGNTVYDSRDNCNAIIETKTNTLLTGCKNTIIPNSVTRIGGSAFESCSGLTNITIPNSVTSIGESAFLNTGCYDNINNWVDGVLYIGNHLIKADADSVSGSYSIKNGTITIGDGAFSDCTGLESITIPNSVKSISYDAFCGCTGLESITIPNSVTSICEYAFSYCTGLESITIPNSVTSICEYAFSHCTGLESITIPNSVTSIGDRVFDGCTGLTSITIPNSVTSIGGVAFYNTGYYNNESNWENGVLYIGNHLIEADSHSISNSYSIKNGTITIAEYAFDYCTGLESITIPNSVTSIGNDAFYDCTDLTDVYYSGTEDDRLKMNIGSGCEDFENATWHYSDPVAEVTEKYLINGNPTDRKRTYEYKSTVTFTANVPEGGSIQWYKDNELVANYN